MSGKWDAPWRRWKYVRLTDVLHFTPGLCTAGVGVYSIAVARDRPHYGPMGGITLAIGAGLLFLKFFSFDESLLKRWRAEP